VQGNSSIATGTFGWSLFGNFDINLDGKLDILISDVAFSTGRGKIWIIYGSGQRYNSTVM
jgi:hypothetical protein